MPREKKWSGGECASGVAGESAAPVMVFGQAGKVEHSLVDDGGSGLQSS